MATTFEYNVTGVTVVLDGTTATATAQEGYTIKTLSASYTGTNGYPEKTEFNVSADGKTATAVLDVDRYTKTVYIHGTVEKDEQPVTLNMTVNVSDCTLNIDGTDYTDSQIIEIQSGVHTFTASAKDLYKFVTVPYLQYYDAEYNNVKKQFTLNETSTVGTLTIKIDASFDELYIHAGARLDDTLQELEQTLTNCSSDADRYIKNGEAVTVTVTANANAVFNTVPRLIWYSEYGYIQEKSFTVSDDKKTASLTFTPSADCSGYNIIADAEAQEIATNYGAVWAYIVTLDNLTEFAGKRFFKATGTDPSTGADVYEQVDLGVYVNRLKRIYTNIEPNGQDVLRCGNYNTGIVVNVPNTDRFTLDFGTITIDPINNTNADFESEINLFLPFKGFITLPSDTIGKTISVQYELNIMGTGVCKIFLDNILFDVVDVEPSTNVLYRTGTDELVLIGADNFSAANYYGLEPFVRVKYFTALNNTGVNNTCERDQIKRFTGVCTFDDITDLDTSNMTETEINLVQGLLTDAVIL